MRNLTSEELKQVYGGSSNGCTPPPPPSCKDHKEHDHGWRHRDEHEDCKPKEHHGHRRHGHGHDGHGHGHC